MSDRDVVKKDYKLNDSKINSIRMERCLKIEKLQDLVNLILEGGEIIAYGMGEVSSRVLTWLTYKKLISNICCVGVKDIKDNPKEFKTLQVYPIKELGIFYSTAKVVVLTAEDKHEIITGELKKLGCEHIYCLSDFCCFQIRYELLDIENSLPQQFCWQNELIRKNTNELAYRMVEECEISNTNTYAFATYRNKFKGKEIAIIATGPSMKQYKYRDDVIHIGLNFAYRRRDIALDFLFVQDGTKIKKDRVLQDEIEKTSNEVKEKTFVGKFLARCQCKDIEITEDIFTRLHNAKRYFTDVFNPVSDIRYEIYQDICYHPLMDFFSVAFPAIHFALFTNPSKVYLVGCDVTNKGYFDKKDVANVLQTGIVKLGYLKLKEFASIYYPNTEIVSINPVGLKGLFKDVYTK